MRILCQALKYGYLSFCAYVDHFQNKEGIVDFGPALTPIGDHFVTNERTRQRFDGAARMVSRYPWAGTLNILIYLEGFNDGEKFVKERRRDFDELVSFMGSD